MVSNTILCILLGIYMYSSAYAEQHPSLNALENDQLSSQLNANDKLIKRLQQQIKLIEDYKIQVNAFENLTQIDLSKSYSESCLAYEKSSSIHVIKLPNLAPFWVSCNADLAGPGWTVIQRRVNGDISFYRDWSSYQQGFGNLSSEFFIGLDKLHAITASTQHELYIHLEDFEGETRYARYDNFSVGNAEEFYELKSLGNYTGDAGDSLELHLGKQFATYDRDNDPSSVAYLDNCAVQYIGAWWYESCHTSNLNGLYLKGETREDLKGRGVAWDSWRDSEYSLKFVQMMIRPKSAAST